MTEEQALAVIRAELIIQQATYRIDAQVILDALNWKDMHDSLENIAHHTDPEGEDGTYRYDSANDACDFAFAEAQRGLGVTSE